MSEITLKPLERRAIEIEIRGTAPLIVNNWTRKAKQAMLDSQQQRKTPKTPKNPEEDFRLSRYYFETLVPGTAAEVGDDGFPATAFKNATVKGGARAFGKSVKMTELRQALFFGHDGFDKVNGVPLILLSGDEPIMREDMVRVGLAKADLRYRAQFNNWGAFLKVEYLPGMIDESSVVALIEAGGINGVGEWRPEKNGFFGTYEVV